MLTEERFQKLEDRMFEVKEGNAAMNTKLDMHFDMQEKILKSQDKLNKEYEDRIVSLEKTKIKLMAFAGGVAAVSGGAANAAWNFISGSPPPPG